MSLIDTECWCYLGQDNFDHGVDHKFELIECEVFNNIEYELKRIGSAL